VRCSTDQRKVSCGTVCGKCVAVTFDLSRRRAAADSRSRAGSSAAAGTAAARRATRPASARPPTTRRASSRASTAAIRVLFVRPLLVSHRRRRAARARTDPCLLALDRSVPLPLGLSRRCALPQAHQGPLRVRQPVAERALRRVRRQARGQRRPPRQVHRRLCDGQAQRAACRRARRRAARGQDARGRVPARARQLLRRQLGVVERDRGAARRVRQGRQAELALPRHEAAPAPICASLLPLARRQPRPPERAC